ncbi:MAG: topoisomerase [Clostridiales bacterium]|jgi:DNA topoisomerase-1|nr:topoisomerase [Clostridiales bacterium]MDK2932275.1 topoisomerase [Clostridiales bacterium]
MASYLVIVESPAKAKTIKKYLGKNYKVLASMGHLRDLPKSQMGVDIEHNFEPKYITIRGKGELLSKLKKEAKNSDKIYLATDPDREGEAISWHLANVLEIKENEKCRIAFNEITKLAVKNAIKAPRKIDINLVNAQQARRILDRIVGYKISPLLWRKVRKGLSAGRVQSVATRLICDREEEIESFVPQEYWTIAANLTDQKSLETFEAKFYGSEEGKIDLENKEVVDKIIDELKDSKYIVKKVKKGERKRNPTPPFITSTLQQEASRKLGFTTKRTMMTAQQLYEGVDIEGEGTIGLITYMRTDSTRIADEAQSTARHFIESKFGKEYVPETPKQYKSKKGAQDAHEAIRPTNVLLEPDKIKSSLKPDQYKLYKLIWERFLASQMRSAIFDTLHVDIEAKNYIFKATGSKIKFQGFMILYIEGNDDETEDGENTIPELVEGQQLKLKKLNPKQHFTQPPPRYTEATLVKALEEQGIGRPSTYAPTIITIIARGYVEREKKQLKPTELGKIITDIMKSHFKDIVDIEFTANMEQQLDEIEEGKKDWVALLREFYQPFSITLKEAEDEIGDVEIQDEVTDEKCEKCGRNMVIKHGRYGKFLACPGFPECRNAKPILEEAGVICPLCNGKVYIKKTRKGKKYYGCENNPKCEFMSWDEPLKEPCPQCGGVLVKKVSKKSSKVQCLNKDCGYERN